MQPTVGSLKAFHGDQFLAVNGRQEADAGIYRAVVDAPFVSGQFAQYDGTRPAVPFGAALFCARATRLVAQVFEHGRGGWQTRHADELAVENEPHRLQVGCGGGGAHEIRSRAWAPSAAAVSGVAPRRYQQRDVVVLPGVCDSECNHHLIDEGRLGQFGSQRAKILGNVEGQPVAAAVQRVSFQQGLQTATVFVRAPLRQQTRRTCSQVVKLDTHARRGGTRREVQHMSRELAHCGPYETATALGGYASKRLSTIVPWIVHAEYQAASSRERSMCAGLTARPVAAES